MNLDPQVLNGLLILLSGSLFFCILTLIFQYKGNALAKKSAVSAHPNRWVTKEKLIIVDIIQETHDIKSFRLKRSNGKDFEKFLPGQFLSFQIGDDEKLARSYSLSSSSENTSTLQVSIKIIPGGVGSSFFNQLKIGDHVLAHPPFGHFSDEGNKDFPSIYIAGGIGITPILSMVKTAIDRAESREMFLYYGMKTTRDLAFHRELSDYALKYRNLHYFPILSEQDENWNGEHGFISLDFIQSKMKVEKHSHFYFCGPAIMTDKISAQLLENGFKPEQIHTEKFVSPSHNEAQLVARHTEIEFEGEVFKYDGSKTILEFLEDSDVAMDSACRAGVCGACKCKLLDGEVDQETDAGLSSGEVKRGYILTCVSRPKTNIKLTY